MVDEPKDHRILLTEGHQPKLAMDGHTPVTLRKGFQPGTGIQGGHQAPTQSLPANPPSGGSSGKPAAPPKK